MVIKSTDDRFEEPEGSIIDVAEEEEFPAISLATSARSSRGHMPSLDSTE